MGRPAAVGLKLHNGARDWPRHLLIEEFDVETLLP